MWRVSQPRMASVSAATSPSTESSVLRASSPAVIDQPVCGGSMKTRSKCASQVSGLSLTAYGGVGMRPSSGTTMRLGPSAPRCSHTDDEPGPPLKAKHSGRVAALTPTISYAVVNSAASGSPRSLPNACLTIGRYSQVAR